MGKARDYIPALKYGHKIYPYDLAGIVGNPFVGNIYYVDANNGSDSAGGKSWEDAFKTLGVAENATTTNNYDVIIVAPAGTSSTSETATITWDKNHITVIGGCAPVHVSQRARIGWGTDEVDPCITISGIGNQFKNMQWNTYQASNDVLVNLTGDRNYFENIHFAGIGHTTAGDDATARCVTLNECSENLFVGCTFGLDTVTRTAANANIELIGAGGCERNRFENCTFVAYTDAADPLFVKFNGAYSAERYAMFINCRFLNATRAGSTTMDAVMDTGVSLNGVVWLEDCWQIGCTDWADDFTNVYMNMGKPDTDEGGFVVVGT